MRGLIIGLSLLFSSLAFSQTNTPCNVDQQVSFSKYVDDKITVLETYLEKNTWINCAEYADYDACRLYGLLDDLKGYSAAKKAYYCSKALVFCGSETNDIATVLKEIYILECDKPYITFDFDRADCSIFAL